MAASADVNAAIEETINRARRLFSSGAGTTLEILKEADKSLSDKLHALVAKHGGPTGSFTEGHAALWRKQIKLATEYLEKRMVGHTHEQATVAIGASVKDTVILAKKLEKRFTGMTRPLALDSQQMQDEVVRGTGASLLRKHQASVARYGTAMVGDFERVLRVAQIEGLDQHQTVSRLVASGKLGGISAKTLHGTEPGYFPEPTGYVKRRYWAERIVRTESAYAYNAAALQTMNVSRQTDFPDMQKKILATFDQRTAPDSIAVHGQVRKLEEMFVDGAGRHYLHPPARPNDRETVIPWRPHWEELPATHEPPAAAQAEAKVAATSGPGPSPAKRKKDLKLALEKAKASVLAKQQGKKQAQAIEAAKAKAKAEHAAGAHAAALATAAEAKAQAKVKEPKLVAELAAKKMAELKAKAAEYQSQTKAAALLKVQAAEAARAAAWKAKAQKEIEALQLFTYGDAGVLLKDLGQLAKQEPALFAQVWKQATGKLSMPKTPKAAVLSAAKALYPDLDYPKPKPKAEAALAKLEKTTAKLLKSKSVTAEIAKLDEQELAALLKAKLPILKEEADSWASMYKSTPSLHPLFQSLLKAQAEAELAAANWKLTDQNVGGQTYVDVFDGNGNKLAYFFKVEGGYKVKPPEDLPDPVGKMFMGEALLTDAKQAAAYAVQVSKAIQMKGGAAKLPASAPQVAKPKAMATPAKPAPPPGQMRWSSKYVEPARPVAKLTDPAKDLRAGLAKDTRHGHSLALDKDWIENFDVSFSTEISAGGKRETVVRFKVTQHHGKEVLDTLRNQGAENAPYVYRKLASLTSDKLVMGGNAGAMPSTWTAAGEVRGARVSMSRAHGGEDGEDLAAGHNLVEIRFPEPKDVGHAYEQTAKVLKGLGIDPERPTEAELKTYKRAKIMAYVDSDAARDLAKIPGRIPAAVDTAWAHAVKRNPILAEVEADAELREVSPGHLALYSPTVAKMLQDSGVRWLKHNVAGDHEVLEQMFIHDRQGGLLSSRERYQRGLIFNGMSTDSDFRTGGADNVFMRVETTNGSASHYGTTIEVDPKELGRLDAYFFNNDSYGKAGKGTRRQTVDQIQNTVRSGHLSDNNEMMMQRQVETGAIRRVITTEPIRAKMLASFARNGITEVNGIPVGEFVVSQ